MSSILKWAIAVFILVAIVLICIAPSVDLPATVLRGILFAVVISGVLKLLGKRLFVRLPKDARRHCLSASNSGSIVESICSTSSPLLC
jgi:acyl CoA:acetate/3-ketoacid CoA transferase